MFPTISNTPALRDWQPTDRLGRSGPIILGCSGSAASLRAIASAPTLLNAPPQAVVVCAVNRRSKWKDRSREADILKTDAYQLAPSSMVDEALRLGREAAWDAGLTGITSRTITADPVHALVDAARRYDATAIVVGIGGPHPSRQIRRLAAAVPDGVALLATDGVNPLIALRCNRSDVPSVDYRGVGRLSRA